jgi:RNase H-fold protein (predicted Holliday junction resolvase)
LLYASTDAADATSNALQGKFKKIKRVARQKTKPRILESALAAALGGGSFA